MTGIEGSGNSYFNDLWIFDTEADCYRKPEVYGTLPSPRRAHAAVLYKSEIIVFGGGNGSKALNDVHALKVADPDRLVWRQLRPKGKKPNQRGYHTMSLVGSKAVVYGGSDGSECFCDRRLPAFMSSTFTHACAVCNSTYSGPR